MTDLILQQQLESIKDTCPWLYSEYKCFDYIVGVTSEALAEMHFKCDPEDILFIVAENPEYFYNDDSHSEKYKIGRMELSELKKAYRELGIINSPQDENVLFRRGIGETLVFCEWHYGEEAGDILDMRKQPRRHIGRIPTPFRWETPRPKPTEAPKPKKPLEKKLEDDLLKWLHSRGVKADNQISTSKHRLDIWLPGVAFLELKRDKVTGDDVCQALDYCNEYKKPVILVGNHISSIALRGAEAFNRAVESEMIIYVSWSAIKMYLRGLLNVR